MIYTSNSSFRLLTEYHSFLSVKEEWEEREPSDVFPSPYGVSFILIRHAAESDKQYFREVSVSLRSIIHSYSGSIAQPSPTIFCVSVSLRSIIHSYPMVKKIFYCNIFLECYRVIFLFLKFFCLFQLKASLTPYFLNIV